MRPVPSKGPFYAAEPGAAGAGSHSSPPWLEAGAGVSVATRYTAAYPTCFPFTHKAASLAAPGRKPLSKQRASCWPRSLSGLHPRDALLGQAYFRSYLVQPPVNHVVSPKYFSALEGKACLRTAEQRNSLRQMSAEGRRALCSL